MVEQECRPTLPMAAVENPASRAALQQGFLVKVVAVEFFIDLTQNLIVLDERHDRAQLARDRLHRIAGVDRVAERPVSPR